MADRNLVGDVFACNLRPPPRVAIRFIAAPAQVRLSFPASDGMGYRLEYTDALGDADWARLPGEPRLDEGGEFSHNDGSAPAAVRRFYRLRAE